MYNQIKSVEEMTDTVYQWDCGFWYDLDVSEKTLEQKVELLEQNILYKKEGDGE